MWKQFRCCTSVSPHHDLGPVCPADSVCHSPQCPTFCVCVTQLQQLRNHLSLIFCPIFSCPELQKKKKCSHRWQLRQPLRRGQGQRNLDCCAATGRRAEIKLQPDGGGHRWDANCQHPGNWNANEMIWELMRLLSWCCLSRRGKTRRALKGKAKSFWLPWVFVFFLLSR